MKIYQNVSLVDLPLSTYDVIVVLKDKNDKEKFIRVQARTSQKSVSFISGTRGGVDRNYISDVKKYRQSTTTSDIIIGVRPGENNSFDLYFVPTILVENLKQDSISLNKIQFLKNNYKILEKCKYKSYVLKTCKANGIF